MKETAEILGNTPAVCRASYVSPGILAAYEKGKVLSDPPTLEALVRASPGALAAVERRLARLLTNGR
jgi:DNA topoisomerase IB